MNSKIKVIFVGPKECGKSTICNFLAENSDSLDTEYVPTNGVRILEIEHDVRINNRNIKADIEIWDTSGDNKYQNLWPVLGDEANGVVFVYNALNSAQLSFLSLWYSQMIDKGPLSNDQCLLMLHRNPKMLEILKDDTKLPSSFKDIRVINTNLEDDAEGLRTKFREYLHSLISISLKKRDQEEQKILK